jgi:GTP:adenosylcobinamide-phosphate guanylyltransferase
MSEYLEYTLETNRKFFDHFYVLTSPEDIKTKELCEKYNAIVIEYSDFFINNYKFNKSGGILHAQKILHVKYRKDWILLLDVDIILTDELMYTISKNIMNKKYLYGVKRYDVWTKDELINKEKKRLYKCNFVGFFQLYHNKKYYYPTYSHNASQCDMNFMKNFKYKKKLDAHVFHIGKEGAHWDGKTDIFQF